MKMELRKTADGSSTLYLPSINEQYHSMNGAVTESEYVFLNMGYNYSNQPNPVIFEVGLGTGLNCLLTADRAEIDKREVFYISIENYPLEHKILEKLDYYQFIQKDREDVFFSIHDCEWNKIVQITPWMKLLKIKADFTSNDWKLPKECDIIYFDAFGPDKQPEMWKCDVFKLMYQIMAPKGVFVTYSAKGQVRRDLITAGFSVERLPGPPGKKQMLRAIK